MANRKIHLVIIDPQNDFCDLPADYRTLAATVPALPVVGAHADMQRVAALIEQGGAGLSAITVTLDSHQHVDIAHPTFWCQGDGSPVAPFTPISAANVREGQFRPRLAEALPRVLAYLEVLEANGRYAHMVWPVHCEIGSWGHNVHDDVRRAYNAWEAARVGMVDKVCKGSNPWTEHYSALKAEVPLADDPATQLNTAFVARLRQADRVLIAGEAGSHCVKATTEHIVENFAAAELGKLVLLSDCMSPVAGFEAQYVDFVDDMRRRGVQIATSTEILPELLANR
ncbi:cysteine hydrolase [Dechloromonas sp. A34]|uniref:cysteine hydrolase n=1 Tax=Dechloromonas sp. A34 TaxID=447588 RepID=UPI002249161C|nr:cysteine hydrolase [Dechloromonas sp. A34]